MPTTEAGKWLIKWLDYHRATGQPLPPNDEAAVDAIEAEAVQRAHAGDAEFLDDLTTEIVATERERIRAAVEGLPIWLPGTQSPRLHGSPEADDYWREVVALPAVLAIIDGDAG